MKIPSDILIEKACSTEATRPAIQEPYLDLSNVGAPCIVATNGTILAHVPVEIDASDVAGFVASSALKAARKLAKRNVPSVLLNRVATLQDGSAMPRNGLAGDSTFPQWRNCVPSTVGKPTARIAFNAGQLALLAQAMGTDGVVLEFVVDDTGKPDNSAPIHVRPISLGRYKGGKLACEGARGVIMPVTQPTV